MFDWCADEGGGAGEVEGGCLCYGWGVEFGGGADYSVQECGEEGFVGWRVVGNGVGGGDENREVLIVCLIEMKCVCDWALFV